MDWDTRTQQQVPEKARYSTQRVHSSVPHQPFFLSSSIRLFSPCVFCSSFFFGQATGVPEWVWHFVTGTGQLQLNSCTNRLSPNLLAAIPQIAQRAHTGSRPTFCLIQAVGLPSRPGPGRIAVVSCHRDKKKMPLDWRVFFLLPVDGAPLHGALTTSWHHLRSLHQPRHASRYLLLVVLLSCTQSMEHHHHNHRMYVTLVNNITKSQQRKKRDGKKKENATAAARHPPGSTRGR